MIKYRQVPAQLFGHCLVLLWNEKDRANLMKCVSFLARSFHMYFISSLRFFIVISFSLIIHFIPPSALFHSYFIPTQLPISLPPQEYFISISFLPSYSLYCLPRNISFLFHSYPAINFIACLGIFHSYFIPTQLPISLPAWEYFIPTQLLIYCLPRNISFLFHSYFIFYLAIFHGISFLNHILLHVNLLYDIMNSTCFNSELYTKAFKSEHSKATYEGERY